MVMEIFNPQKIEKEVLSFWKRNNIYRKVKLSRKGRKVFYFADGPPYATGSIHMGTAQNKIGTNRVMTPTASLLNTR
jgi:isoleucyl-tRNA synthetase